jgi:tRNA A-37 threonylcarbamoyl transferase component Bud32
MSIPDARSPQGRFRQECEMMSSLRHPNVVQYLGTHVDEANNLILLMELMDQSLTHFLESGQPLPFHTQVNICHDISLALSFLHSKGIIHRDLSGHNVLMIGDRRAKVTDFGMARWQVENRTLTACPGTKVYMPPEALDEVRPEYDTAIDCFSLGVVAIQILTRKFPCPGKRSSSSNPNDLNVIFYTERQRRRAHIDSIDPQNPILLLALPCLDGSPNQRPSARQLCLDFERMKEKNDYNRSMSHHSSTPGRSATGLGQREREEMQQRGGEELHRREREREEFHWREGEREERHQREREEMHRRERELQQALSAQGAEFSAQMAEVTAELERLRREKAKEEALLKDRDGEVAFLQVELERQRGFLGGGGSVSESKFAQLQQDLEEQKNLVIVFERERMVALKESEEVRLLLTKEVQKNKDAQELLTDMLKTKGSPAQPMNLASSLPTNLFRKRAQSAPGATHTVQLHEHASLTFHGDTDMAVTADLKPLAMLGKSSKVRVMSSYEVSFTPESRGWHKLEVSVNGASSISRDVFVEQRIENIQGALVKSIPCKNSTPFKVCYSNRLIYYSDHVNQKYHVMDGCSQELITSVWCKRKIKYITVDMEGCVYFTSDHQLHKFSAQGEKLAVVGDESSGSGDRKLNTPEGLAVELDRGCIHVCDSHNSRVVVYNYDLGFVAKYGEGISTKIKVPKSGNKPGHLQGPVDIAFSKRGKAFVLDVEKKAVVVFYNKVYDSIIWLDAAILQPVSLCFRGAHLLVVDWIASLLSVYHTPRDHWELLRHIAVEGCPVDVCTDSDGYIYLVDSTNSALKVY